jgi:hypothetical protein
MQMVGGWRLPFSPCFHHAFVTDMFEDNVEMTKQR